MEHRCALIVASGDDAELREAVAERFPPGWWHPDSVGLLGQLGARGRGAQGPGKPWVGAEHNVEAAQHVCAAFGLWPMQEALRPFW